MSTAADDPLWSPSPAAVARAAMTAFSADVSRRHPGAAGGARALHAWSVAVATGLATRACSRRCLRRRAGVRLARRGE